jgi:hypothetical protein
MRQRRKYSYLAKVLVVIGIFSIRATAQDRNIWQEYRVGFFGAMPVNEKWVPWQFDILIYSPEKKLTTLGVTAPGIPYRPFAKKGESGWLELWAGTLFAPPTTMARPTALRFVPCRLWDILPEGTQSEYIQLWALRVQALFRKPPYDI